MFDNSYNWGSFNSLLFVVSIALGLTGCITRQVKRIKVEKGFLKFSTALILYLWACCAALRRVVSTVVFFVPAMGLISILNHWKAEQIPFGAAQSVRSTSRVDLFNETEELLWRDISRWNTDNPDHPTPPPYTLYTGLTLETTFKGFLYILFLHFFSVLMVKICTVKIYVKETPFNWFVDVLESMNVPSPFRDWDTYKGTVEQHKRRYAMVSTEMMCLYGVTLTFTMIMLIPLWWTGRCYIFVNSIKNFSSQFIKSMRDMTCWLEPLELILLRITLMRWPIT